MSSEEILAIDRSIQLCYAKFSKNVIKLFLLQKTEFFNLANRRIFLQMCIFLDLHDVVEILALYSYGALLGLSHNVLVYAVTQGGKML